eukprot:CAMPEP_0205929842 /NCGR_PEP_ID=MMETSP1325-20131115/25535_1 /ASSEMBLY_ACC=CAM_ASM_000708 /TAXON_ID=236786 /ORGANISM="Florenciella sp., Strain RCC1007" /LENGTH=361 /DNA_ID=CAMNT_0053299115 /DNA_START=62 /DNA_END=1143 /DNA_ORIENTATION=-
MTDDDALDESLLAYLDALGLVELAVDMLGGAKDVVDNDGRAVNEEQAGNNGDRVVLEKPSSGEEGEEDEDEEGQGKEAETQISSTNLSAEASPTPRGDEQVEVAIDRARELVQLRVLELMCARIVGTAYGECVHRSAAVSAETYQRQREWAAAETAATAARARARAQTQEVQNTSRSDKRAGRARREARREARLESWRACGGGNVAGHAEEDEWSHEDEKKQQRRQSKGRKVRASSPPKPNATKRSKPRKPRSAKELFRISLTEQRSTAVEPGWSLGQAWEALAEADPEVFLAKHRAEHAAYKEALEVYASNKEEAAAQPRQGKGEGQQDVGSAFLTWTDANKTAHSDQSPIVKGKSVCGW